MKKLISLLLAFAMVFSLAMPAMAVEVTGNTENPTSGDVTASYTPTPAEITGLKVTVDGVTYTSGQTVTLTPDSGDVTITVIGTNLQNRTEKNKVKYISATFASMGSGYTWNVNDSGTETSKTYTSSEFASQTSAFEMGYCNDGSTNYTGSGIFVVYDNGSSEEDAAEITGVSITVDGTEYKSGNVTITPNSTVTLTVTGTNLQNGTADNLVQYASGRGESLATEWFTFSGNGTTATMSPNASAFANSSNFQISYYNNYTAEPVDRVLVGTGIYVTYDDGSSEPANVSVSMKLAAKDANGVDTPALYAIVSYTSLTTFSSTNMTISTGEYTLTGWGNVPTGYKTPADVSLTVTDTDGDGVGEVTTTSDHASVELVDGVYVITVTLEAEGTEETTYTVTIGETTNGTVDADKATAAEGDTVTLTATPNTGYALYKWIVTDADGEAVTVNTDNTFTMPASAVSVSARFLKPGTDLTKLYFNNGGSSDWTNVTAFFYTSDDEGLGYAELSIVAGESNIYATTEIPEWAAKVLFRNGSGGTQVVEIPMAAANTDQFNRADSTWSKFTATEQSTTSAEITWGSLAFTYTDGSGWANDGSEGAGTVTVKNTGDTTFTDSVEYKQETGYEEITGSFDTASAEVAAEASKTFTLTLENQPAKAIAAGTKIGSVTVTIE